MSERFWDHWWAGVGIGVVCVLVIIIAFSWGYQIGHQFGWEYGSREARSEVGGVYVEVALGGGRALKGFVK